MILAEEHHSTKSPSEIPTNINKTPGISSPQKELTQDNISTVEIKVSPSLSAQVNTGNVLPICQIPEGTTVCNI